MTRSPEHRAVLRAAALLIAGVVLSGPLALLVVGLVHPQPAWVDAATFARAYHPVQLLPYAGGFALIGGFVLLLASLHTLAPPAARARTTAALVRTAGFAALIVLNYVLQTTFVPALVQPLGPADAPLVAAVTMANPGSLAWALEMWGYGVLGVATWLMAAVFTGRGVERVAAAAFVGNGVLSVAGALAMVAWRGWVLGPVGLAGFALWNLLVVGMAALAIAVIVRRDRGP